MVRIPRELRTFRKDDYVAQVNVAFAKTELLNLINLRFLLYFFCFSTYYRDLFLFFNPSPKGRLFMIHHSLSKIEIQKLQFSRIYKVRK